MSRDICLRCLETSQKRRGRDSNPRRRKTPRNGFRDRAYQDREATGSGSLCAFRSEGTAVDKTEGIAEGMKTAWNSSFTVWALLLRRIVTLACRPPEQAEDG